MALFGSSSPKIRQLPTQTPAQMALTGQAGNIAQGLLGQLNQPFGQSPIAQQARQQFQTQTIPTIAERFSSLGAQNSSAFQNALGQAGVGLESNLASLGQQNQNQLLHLLLGTEIGRAHV